MALKLMTLKVYDLEVSRLPRWGAGITVLKFVRYAKRPDF
jgi:hypothetical protein